MDPSSRLKAKLDLLLDYHEIGSHLDRDMFRILHIDRAVDLEAGEGETVIECNLASTALGENPSYEALSYCWDVPQPRIAIICNQRKLHIRSNLHSALRCLRLTDRPRTIWADAVCINQENLEERARQVGLMKDIFAKADEVIVWLGEEADNSTVGIQAAQDLADAGREYLKQRKSLENLPEDDPLVLALFRPFQRPSQFHRFDAMSKIIDRNWFGRTWIVQEAAVANKIRVFCGPAAISWEDLMNAVVLQNQLDLYTSTHDRNTPALIIRNTRIDYQAGVYRDLLSVMYRHRMFAATDPRDKVYGLGALAGDELAKRFMANVDYTVDALDFYRRLATDMLKTYPGLIALSVPPGLTSEHAEGLPSWVPDWRVTRKSPCIGLTDSVDIHEVRYRAGGNSQESISFDETGLLLSLNCCWIDTIEAVGRVMVVDDLPHGFPGVLRLAKVSYMLDEWRAVAKAVGNNHDTDYVTGGSVLDAFIRTLVGNPPDLTISFMREQFSILDRQARLIRWMGRLHGQYPKVAEKYLVLFFEKAFKVPKTNLAFAFGYRLGPLADRTVFRTKKGYIGLATIRAAAGDRIAVPQGGRVPIVLRQAGDKWQMRGDAYLHGVMNGEGFDVQKAERVQIA